MQLDLLKNSGKLSILLTIMFVSVVSAQEIINESQSDLDIVEFPVITEYVNDKLFVGNIKEIKATLEKHKIFINQLVNQLDIKLKRTDLEIEKTEKNTEIEYTDVYTNLSKSKISEQLNLLQAQREKIIGIISSFKDIHYKHVNLLQILEGADDKNQKQTYQTSEPYRYLKVLKLNDYLYKINNDKLQQQIQIKEIEQRIKKLVDVLSDAVIEYTILLSKDKKSLDLYSSIRNIYLFQVDYALLKIKNDKTHKLLALTNRELEDNQKLFPKMIREMLVKTEDIDSLGEELDETNKDLKKLQLEHLKLNKDFDDISFNAELELDNLEVKINYSNSESEIEKAQLQKQLHLNKIKYSYFIKNLLKQKELHLEIQRDNQTFNLSWLQAYNHKKNHDAFKDFTISAQAKLTTQNELRIKNLELLDSLNRSSLEISSSKQKFNDGLVTLQKQKKELNKQLEKNLKTIQRLSSQLNVNIIAIQKSIDKNSRIIKVLTQQFNKIEQIGQWFGDKFSAQFIKIKNVLYYPITSIGDKPFTLAILLKVMLYIILGIIILKLFRTRFTRFLHKRTKLSEGAAFSIATLVYYIGGLLVFLMALSSSGYNLGQMMIVFGALGVGIGFGLQNIANNFLSGMILLIDRTLTVGDSVTLSDGVHGKVVKLAMRYTVIHTNGGYDIIVPNSELVANRVTSMTFKDNYLRIEIPFGVSYKTDPELVQKITLEVANKVKHTVNRSGQKTVVLFSGFGDNSLDFVLRVWVFIFDRYRPYAIKSDYYYSLLKAFKEAGIDIPFPQRDLHIKSLEKDVLKSIHGLKDES